MVKVAKGEYWKFSGQQSVERIQQAMWFFSSNYVGNRKSGQVFSMASFSYNENMLQFKSYGASRMCHEN